MLPAISHPALDEVLADRADLAGRQPGQPAQSEKDSVTRAAGGSSRRPSGNCSATGTGSAASWDSILGNQPLHAESFFVAVGASTAATAIRAHVLQTSRRPGAS